MLIVDILAHKATMLRQCDVQVYDLPSSPLWPWDTLERHHSRRGRAQVSLYAPAAPENGQDFLYKDNETSP